MYFDCFDYFEFAFKVGAVYFEEKDVSSSSVSKSVKLYESDYDPI